MKTFDVTLIVIASVEADDVEDAKREAALLIDGEYTGVEKVVAVIEVEA